MTEPVFRSFSWVVKKLIKVHQERGAFTLAEIEKDARMNFGWASTRWVTGQHQKEGYYTKYRDNGIEAAIKDQVQCQKDGYRLFISVKTGKKNKQRFYIHRDYATIEQLEEFIDYLVEHKKAYIREIKQKRRSMRVKHEAMNDPTRLAI